MDSGAKKRVGMYDITTCVGKSISHLDLVWFYLAS